MSFCQPIVSEAWCFFSPDSIWKLRKLNRLKALYSALEGSYIMWNIVETITFGFYVFKLASPLPSCVIDPFLRTGSPSGDFCPFRSVSGFFVLPVLPASLLFCFIASLLPRSSASLRFCFSLRVCFSASPLSASLLLCFSASVLFPAFLNLKPK